MMSSELNPTLRRAIVLELARLARESYIYPEIGAQTAQAILEHCAQGRYEDILDPDGFADRLTSDLRQASGDQHWSVSFDSALTSALYAEEEETTEENLAQLRQHIYRTNFGIEKVEHLPGNIGYVDLRSFAWIGFPGAGDSIVALMQLVSHCDALIFDLRRNHGGEVETLQLYLSYFVKPEPKLYDSFYYRPTDETQQFWTMPYVPGKRMPEVPIYILTSGVTASGGEAFAYILKNMRQATVIGEPTQGAAHTTDLEIVQEHFQVEFPSGRSISPFTHGDWEGTGVLPDIRVPTEQALQVAHLGAIEKLIGDCPDERHRQELGWDLEIARNLYTPAEVAEAALRRCTGEFGDRTFCLSQGALVYSRQGNAGTKLIPLSETRYLYPNAIKFEFSLDEQGEATSVTISYREERGPITITRSD
jgi:hypothetical protein